jgi:Electron transfer DM13
MRRWFRSHPVARVVVPLVALAALGLGIYWFAPQRLVLDRAVSEELPSSSRTAEADPTASAAPPVAEPTELGRGAFRSLEHGTTGVARVVELEDGSRFVRFEDLDTSDGPDLRVYLTDQPVSDDWHVWDDGRYLDLGALKGNVGDSNYAIPDGVELDAFRTVVIWCRRFTVGFAVAPI